MRTSTSKKSKDDLFKSQPRNFIERGTVEYIENLKYFNTVIASIKLPAGQTTDDLVLNLETRDGYNGVEAIVIASSFESDEELQSRLGESFRQEAAQIQKEKAELARLIKKHGIPKA
jgi:hypothetical protein